LGFNPLVSQYTKKFLLKKNLLPKNIIHQFANYFLRNLYLLMVLPLWLVDWYRWNMYGFSDPQKWSFLFGLTFLVVIVALFHSHLLPEHFMDAIWRFDYPQCSKKTKLILIFVFSLAIAVLLYGNTLRGNWWVIDDHELINFMGPTGRLAWKEFIPKLLQTEVGQPGAYVRYRPIYFIFRLLGAAVLGNHPILWYAVQLAILIFFICTLWYLTAQFIGLLSGGLFTLFILSGLYWPDIFARLGADETYAVLGFTFFVLGAYGVITHAELRALKLDWLFILLGSIIAVGSKENEIILIVPLAFLFIFQLKRRKFSRWILIAFMLSMGWILSISSVLVVALAATGMDQYANSVHPVERIGVLIHGIFSLRGVSILIPLLISLGLWGYYARFCKKPIISKYLRYLSFSIMAIFVFYLSQYVFYNGYWPANNRYDFPGMLYTPLLFLLIYSYGVKIYGEQDQTRKSVSLIHFFIPVVMLIAILVYQDGFAYANYAVGNHVELSNNFSNQINSIGILSKADSRLAIILEAGAPFDYEPIISYAKFLRADGVSNPIYVRWTGPDSASYSNLLFTHLVSQIQAWSQTKTDLFNPLSDLGANPANCISIRMNGKPLSQCRQFDAVITR
jgi:hypothetical protein